MSEAKTRLTGRLARPGPVRSAERQARRLAARLRPPEPGQAVPDWAVLSAVLSPVLLTVAWLVADALQPAGDDPVRQTVSVLAGHAGTDRWIMTSALFLAGPCYLMTAIGLAELRLPARLLLVLAGICSVGIATAPEPAACPTAMHLAWTAIGGITIALWPAFASQPEPGKPLILTSRGSAVVTAVFVAMFGWVLLETQGGDMLGLAERMTATVQTGWPLVVAVALRRAAETAAEPAGEAVSRPGPDA